MKKHSEADGKATAPEVQKKPSCIKVFKPLNILGNMVIHSLGKS